MSGVRKFLSRRDKSPGHQKLSAANNKPDSSRAARKPDHFGGIFTLSDDPTTNQDPTKKHDKDEERKIHGILERLRAYGINTIVESNVRYALHHSAPKGDPEVAFRLLMLLEDTYEGIVRPYSPDTKLLGAVNREATTCYLDSLLFAMFARLDSFEAMVYDSFEDLNRRKLAGLLRLWVNMLRTGRLIPTDVTAHLQGALADCGWTEARRIQQQDPSEAFTFITGQLELPMLTLKMDMYHTGQEDPQDDHKFVNERLLEVAIPDEPLEGQGAITLEHCLEQYFNNRIEVKRHLERQRRNTLKSDPFQDGDVADPEKEKESGSHVEVAELAETPKTEMPPLRNPASEGPAEGKSPVEKLRPTSGRRRNDSIFSQRRIELTGIDPGNLKGDQKDGATEAQGKKLGTRTEVLMPAWQFFKLLPWYTDHMPMSDAQVAAHFSRKRPTLGICLKRYSYTNDGQARRRDTYVDIPLEIAVPNFVGDDNMQDEGPLVGNFRLMLQSVVCHRGVSVNSGHYISLCRGRASNAQRDGAHSMSSSCDSFDLEDPWMRFDDMARERVTYVDIHQALQAETPYLLFYQVQPIGDDGRSIHDLPSYTEATSRSESDSAPLEKHYLQTDDPSPDRSLNQSLSEPLRPPTNFSTATSTTDFGASPSARPSTDASASPFIQTPSLDTDSPRNTHPDKTTISPSTTNISSTTAPNPSTHLAAPTNAPGRGTSASVPTTPLDEKPNSFLAVAGKLSGSRRGRRSRPDSANDNSESTLSAFGGGGPGRFSLNMARLKQRRSRGDDLAGLAGGMQPSDAVAKELAGQRDVGAGGNGGSVGGSLGGSDVEGSVSGSEVGGGSLEGDGPVGDLGSVEGPATPRAGPTMGPTLAEAPVMGDRKAESGDAKGSWREKSRDKAARKKREKEKERTVADGEGHSHAHRHHEHREGHGKHEDRDCVLM